MLPSGRVHLIPVIVTKGCPAAPLNARLKPAVSVATTIPNPLGIGRLGWADRQLAGCCFVLRSFTRKNHPYSVSMAHRRSDCGDHAE